MLLPTDPQPAVVLLVAVAGAAGAAAVAAANPALATGAKSAVKTSTKAEDRKTHWVDGWATDELGGVQKNFA